ncbi:MAG TPA: APC family permease [Myxococcota bacterium]|nr:APC family permease [Myxococcota bacterium]HOD08321.1 APC family permease [Myxococcota bacterium]
MNKPEVHGRGPVSSPTIIERMVALLMGKPRNLREKGLFQKIALIPLLAWVGLGADGLSSSSYGPQESFRALGEHWYLAVALAVATVITISVISLAYARIITRFPGGGGGYVVANNLLGPHAGVLAGSALTIDYVLTVTVSIAAAGDALFSFLPPGWAGGKFPFELAMILVLITLNARGLKEAITPLVPIFILFIITHVALIGGAIILHVTDIPRVERDLAQGFRDGWSSLGLLGMLAVFAKAWSLGGGSYTGIEAVSNGLPLLKEPRVKTAHRTMLYMGVSLALTAGGLMIGYLILGVQYQDGKTLNAVLSEAVFGGGSFGRILVIATLISEGAMLIVGAQAGFIGGPRILANMSMDGWVPKRFGALSTRLTSGQGILIIGVASVVALLYTRGDVTSLVVMYAINVFLTFSLSMAGMLKDALMPPDGVRRRPLDIGLFFTGLMICLSILTITTWEKRHDAGWLTIGVTMALTLSCYAVRAHYRKLGRMIASLDGLIPPLPDEPDSQPVDQGRDGRTAVILVGRYGGLGVGTTLDVIRHFPGVFRRFVFVSAGIVDASALQYGVEADQVLKRTREDCRRYVELASRFRIPARYRTAVTTNVNDELEKICVQIRDDFDEVTFFAGQLVFARPRWYHHWLHNNTAFDLQNRLLMAGCTMVIVPRLVSLLPGHASLEKGHQKQRKTN